MFIDRLYVVHSLQGTLACTLEPLISGQLGPESTHNYKIANIYISSQYSIKYYVIYAMQIKLFSIVYIHIQVMRGVMSVLNSVLSYT